MRMYICVGSCALYVDTICIYASFSFALRHSGAMRSYTYTYVYRVQNLSTWHLFTVYRRMYVSMHIYIYIYIFTYIYIHTHVHVDTYIYKFVYTFTPQI